MFRNRRRPRIARVAVAGAAALLAVGIAACSSSQQLGGRYAGGLVHRVRVLDRRGGGRRDRDAYALPCGRDAELHLALHRR